MKFTKMHGIGNDYVYVNAFTQTVSDPAALAVRVSDRHFGIGSDGLILVMPSDSADVRMRMFNADGSESEMCGNGIRCVAKFAYDKGLSRANPMKIQTGRGVLTVELQLGTGGKVSQVTVNMGEPILDLASIPVDGSKLTGVGERRYRLEVGGESYECLFVSMGNPHAVIFVDDVKSVALETIGPKIEHHVAFPRRINVHFVQVHSPAELTMRTWERGSGITLACGTGACAVGVAGVLASRVNREVLVHLPGGDLTLDWQVEDNCVYMTGPAADVFEGDWPDAR